MVWDGLWLGLVLRLGLGFRVQRCADPEILGLHQSAYSDKKSASAIVGLVLRSHGSAVSPHLQVTATPCVDDDSYPNPI